MAFPGSLEGVLSMKITVAVPTIRGRSTYLASCLRTCVSQDDGDLEILVSDNSAEGEARPVVDSFIDKRIRYVKPPGYLPMSAHWDFVLSQLSGDLFTFIGDDDGLMPGCISRVRELRSQVGHMPIQHSLCNYRWPDYFDEKTRNQLLFHHRAGWDTRVVESSEYLAGVARATLRYIDGPMLYHNFIPTSLVRGLTANGVFFRRSSPDVYSAVSIAANTPRFFSTEEVLTISGQGAKANGAAIQAGRADEFMAETSALYTPRYGIRAVQMALLDALTEVAEQYNRPELLSNVRYAAHFVAAIREARSMAQEARMPEIKAAFAAAKRHGVVLNLVAKLVGGAIKTRLWPSVKPHSSSDHAFEQGDRFQLPESVRDIYGASRAAADLLASASVESRR
jgi:Glycosyl transferase family 2